MLSDVIAGYCWPLSASPGDSIDFFISAANSYILDYVRLSDLDENGSGAPLLSRGKQTALVQPAYANAWRDGCGWETTSQLTVPADWPSGLYAARLTQTDATNVQPTFVVFIVKPKDTMRGDYLLLAHTLTWNAYNDLWGPSRYTDPGNVFWLSFMRPNPKASPLYRDIHLLHAESWVLKWMQGEGHHVDVVTDHDFHYGIPMLYQYAGIILNTHPEYWTQMMVDRLRQYLNAGGCVVYLGGNGLFERVQLDDGGRRLVFHGGVTTPNSDRAKQFFRNLNPPQPEREILGVAFLYDNYSSEPAPYAVLLPEHRFFEGTGLGFMSEIGKAGRSGGASGREMDSSRGGNAPEGKIVNAWVTWPHDGTQGTDRGFPPSNVQVLARGTNEQFLNEDGVLEGPHAAEMTYYDTQAGGFVFSVGSMTFGGSLVEDATLQKIVNNVLRNCLRVRNERPAFSLKEMLKTKHISFPVSIRSLANDFGLIVPISVRELIFTLFL